MVSTPPPFKTISEHFPLSLFTHLVLHTFVTLCLSACFVCPLGLCVCPGPVR